MIRLKCVNENCLYSYEVTKAELEEYGQYHKVCLICGSQLKVDNLDEVVKFSIEEKVKNNLDEWFKTIGIEATIEMCERNKDMAVYRLYKIEIEKRGFKLKEN